MKAEEVRSEVARLGTTEFQGDSEMSHLHEDEIWETVLQAIASGATNAAALASEALKTRTFEFQRWYA